MIRRFASISLLLALLMLAASCSRKNKNVTNPIANVNSAQPDKVLFDRAMDAMQRNRFDVARLTLQTMINTYPDSEYIARAKLAVGDSWYAEGGSAGLAQAEIEYKDFITFFPNLPEAAEAQLKVANIHYRQMEKPDRDFTHAKRAEEEYKQLILQFPDSKLVPEAKQRLREVQEVLAEREFRIGRFYYLRESWPAATARLKTVADTYPLYSGADENLFLLGESYEHMAERARAVPIGPAYMEDTKARVIKLNEDQAAAAYSKIVSRYPAMPRVSDAKARLEALHRPVPQATQEAMAQNKAEERSREEMSHFSKLMLNFRRKPDTSHSAKLGEPTLVNPTQTSAIEVNRQTESVLAQGAAGGSGAVTIEKVAAGEGPPPNAPIPRSSDSNTSSSSASDNSIPELKPTGEAAQPPNQAPQTPPAQLNEAADSQGSSQGAAAGPGSSSQSQPAQADGSSSSKSKKKKGLRKLVPF